jgi:hypothetical protein
MIIGTQTGRSVYAALITAALATATAGCGSQDGTGSGGGHSGAGGGGGSGGAAETPEWDALLRGTLATSDKKAEAIHDPLAKGGEKTGKDLGDFAHFAMLGTTILGTHEDEFLVFDRWHENNMNKFYGNPTFQKDLAPLFASPPTLEQFQRQEAWEHWGEVDSGRSASEFWFVVIRGELADPATAQATHDAGAKAAKDTANQLGDVSHTAYLGTVDAKQTLILDVWVKSDHIQDFYSQPSFQKGFASLFAEPPTLGVYHSTHWYQW